MHARMPGDPTQPARQGHEPGASRPGGVRGPAAMRSAGDVLRLQADTGNATVSRWLQRQPLPVQRTKESRELLTDLADPKVREGPAIEVQTELVNALEKLISEKTLDHVPVFSIGGVVLDRLPDSDEQLRPETRTTEKSTPEEKAARAAETGEIFGRLTGDSGKGDLMTRFTPLSGGGVVARSAGVEFGPQVRGLAHLVMENSLKTMIDAEQVEYLRLAGLPNDKWVILVELHYVRSRPKDMAGFHKDTRGQSLFVNLNYHMPGRRTRGPEYVLNPPPSAEHDEQVRSRGTLPPEFSEDLGHTRNKLGVPSRIELPGDVPPLGYVAFVDEAIHHATPWFGHRYVTAKELSAYLQRHHAAKFAEISRAEEKFKGSRWPAYLYPFSSYVKREIISGDDELETWRRWHRMVTPADDRRYTREDFASILKNEEFDEMLHDIGAQEHAPRDSGGSGGWHSASIPGVKPSAAQAEVASGVKSPIRPEGSKPLVRASSRSDLTKDLPDQLPEDVPRRFIRTWVRAVPRAVAKEIPS